MFKDDLSEMDDSRAVVQNLVDEYLEATKDTYLQWEPRVCIKCKKSMFYNYLKKYVKFVLNYFSRKMIALIKKKNQ